MKRLQFKDVDMTNRRIMVFNYVPITGKLTDPMLRPMAFFDTREEAINYIKDHDDNTFNYYITEEGRWLYLSDKNTKTLTTDDTWEAIMEETENQINKAKKERDEISRAQKKAFDEQMSKYKNKDERLYREKLFHNKKNVDIIKHEINSRKEILEDIERENRDFEEKIKAFEAMPSQVEKSKKDLESELEDAKIDNTVKEQELAALKKKLKELNVKE